MLVLRRAATAVPPLFRFGSDKENGAPTIAGAPHFELGGSVSRDRRIAAELGDHLLVGVEIGEDDDLADLGVLVARGPGAAEAAPPAGRAAGAPADVALAEIALGERFLLGGAGVDEGQSDAGLALLDVDAAGDAADHARRAAEVAEDPADRRAGAAAARLP